jgi:hypothetical protein
MMIKEFLFSQLLIKKEDQSTMRIDSNNKEYEVENPVSKGSGFLLQVLSRYCSRKD